MWPPKIVLCAVDLTKLAAREVAIASELCEAFGARLVLHHNVASVAPGLTRAWEWKEVHRDTRESATEVDHAMRVLMSGVPRTVPVEASVTSGALVPILLDLANRLPADLLVLGSHGWSNDEHASVAERVIARAPCPVVSIHDGYAATAPLRMRAQAGHAAPEVVVAVDRTDVSGRVLGHAFDLARTLGLRLHLLHVEAAGATSRAHDEAHRRLAERVPPDLVARVDCHLDSGDPSERIMSFLHERAPAFAVMGEHARGFVGRYFTHDTARDVLHRAPCPVWFVPPA
ncbi:MAG: universal stress protein [Deltaproteobacteria bacterium]|nr:universal stress protein [Deltaproteobacteria bacterium]